MSQTQDISEKLKVNPYFASLRITSNERVDTNASSAAAIREKKKIARQVASFKSGRSTKYIAHNSTSTEAQIIETLKAAGAM